MNSVELLPKSQAKSYSAAANDLMGYYCPVTQPGSNWRFTVKEWEAMDTSDRKGNSDYILGKKVFMVRVAKCWKKCPEGLWNLHPWRSSRLDRTHPWKPDLTSQLALYLILLQRQVRSSYLNLLFIKTQFCSVTAFQDSFFLSAAWLIFLIPRNKTYDLVVLNSPSSDCRN